MPFGEGECKTRVKNSGRYIFVCRGGVRLSLLVIIILSRFYFGFQLSMIRQSCLLESDQGFIDLLTLIHDARWLPAGRSALKVHQPFAISEQRGLIFSGGIVRVSTNFSFSLQEFSILKRSRSISVPSESRIRNSQPRESGQEERRSSHREPHRCRRETPHLPLLQGKLRDMRRGIEHDSSSEEAD